MEKVSKFDVYVGVYNEQYNTLLRLEIDVEFLELALKKEPRDEELLKAKMQKARQLERQRVLMGVILRRMEGVERREEGVKEA